jgi:predicted metal-dependent peptidase
MSIKKSAIDQGWVALQQGRQFVKARFPYFYTTLLGLVPHHVRGIGTMFVTRGMVLGIDMEWLPSLPTEHCGGILIHEVMHVLRDLRRIEAMPNPEVAAYAFDMPINDDLKAFGVPLPEWAVYSSTHGFPPGLSGEKYYELCIQKGIFPPDPQIGAGRCGTCSGFELKDVAPIPDDIQRIPAEVMHFRRQGLASIKSHLDGRGYGRGQSPGSLRELLEFKGNEEAIVPWAQVLNSVMGRTFGRITQGHSDYSLRRPAKRSYSVGLLRPGLIGYEPNVCVIEDTSGSMGQKQLRENRVEIANAMKKLGLTDVWWISADTEVRNVPIRITVNELMTLPVIGRGGTDFEGPIEAAMKLRPTPDAIIYSTDGDGFAPEFKPRGTEFIWLLAPGPWTRSPCNWGIQILTTDDPKERKRYTLLAR